MRDEAVSGEARVTATPGSSPAPVDTPKEAIQTHVRARLEAIDLEQTVLEVIREEVARILPAIVESVVRERVAEIEREIEAQERHSESTDTEPS